MKTLTAAQKGQEQLSGKGMMCPDCGQKTSGLDHCEWCGSPLLDGSEPIRLKVETLADKEEVKINAQKALKAVLAEQRPRKQNKIKKPKERKSLVIEDTTGPGLAPEIDREKFLEVYPVNEPYAYIGIEVSQPHTYQVCEVSLTRGEEELLKEIRAWLYEVIDLDFASLDKPEDFLRQKVQEITREFGIRLSPSSMERIMYYVARALIGYGRLDPILREKSAEDISDGGGRVE